MDNRPPTFQPGDSVVVKSGIQDPLWHTPIGGWQGRIVELETDAEGTPRICIEWDSLTLRAMPPTMIEQCESRDLDWTALYLHSSEVEPATPRDTPADVQKTAEQIARRYVWLSLGEEGKRIQRVLIGVNPDSKTALLEAWYRHLSKKLTFPFQVEIIDTVESLPLQPGQIGVVHKLAGLDSEKGLLVSLSARRQHYTLPLSLLEPVEERSPNYLPINDYITWFDSQYQD